MAKVNQQVLAVIDAQRDDDDPRLTTKNQGPPLGMLQSKARSLGAFQLDNLVGKFNPENITLKQRKLMRRDPMIKMGLHYRKVPLLNAPWHVECEDAQIKYFVENSIKDIYTKTMVQMLLKLDWGYVPMVRQFKRGIPTWTYEDPTTREPQDVWPEKNIPALLLDDFIALPPDGAEVMFTSDDQKFDGFKHHGFTKTKNDYRPLRVQKEYALWLTNERDDSFGDWYGYPITGYVYRYWWSYWYRFLLADRHFEQDADPPLVVEYPEGTGPDPDDPDSEVDNYVIALKVGVNLRDGATIAIPSDVYEAPGGDKLTAVKKWTAEFLRGGENMRAFQESFDYLDTLKLRGLLVPEEAILPKKGDASVGTLSDMLVESLTIDMQELDSIWNEHIIPQLVAANFVDPPPVKKVTENFRTEDIGSLLELISVIASQDPASLTIDWREASRQAGYPLMSQDQIDEAEQKAEEKAQKAFAQQQELALQSAAQKNAGGRPTPGAASKAGGGATSPEHKNRKPGTTQDGAARKKNPNRKGPTG